MPEISHVRIAVPVQGVLNRILREGGAQLLGADCWRLVLGRSVLVLAEPLTEGYVAACLARFGEGPIAVALDGAPATGRPALRNPVSDGMATYVRIAPKTAPTLIFLPPR